MKSEINTADSILADKAKYSIQKSQETEIINLKIDILSFNKLIVQDFPKRSISKIIDLSKKI
jgi:hypothetical protein